ncbi:MAG: M23 family metallopeptidase [Rhodospirillales bacterium]|nr:M23 family metallopeptidase [Rhodospirillales bacterium]
MRRSQYSIRCLSVLIVGAAITSSAWAQTPIERFSYYGPGAIIDPPQLGAKNRRVYLPSITFPIRVGPDAGEDGTPLHAYANSQVYRPFADSNEPRLYVYPWVDTLCESKHLGGPMHVCGERDADGSYKTIRAHQGIDIRPNLPKNRFYDVIAAEAGTVFKISNTTSLVSIRHSDGTGTACSYLHLMPIFVREGQVVKKGDVIGKVANVAPDGGTSIHLHFQCRGSGPDIPQNVVLPVYASLISAYRRAWGLSDAIQNGVLLRDPEREREGPLCGEPLSEQLAATKDLPLVGRYMHNCSEMGLIADRARFRIVYLRPKASLAAAAQRQPELVSGTTVTAGHFEGQAVNYNRACGDPKFPVKGTLDIAAASFTLEGQRTILDGACRPSGVSDEELIFAKLVPQAPPTDPLPSSTELTCPFALPPGQQPTILDGREIPPKSERSCNFTAITLPGNMNFEQMPRYVREWPGVRREMLTDAFQDQILTFQTAETGVGVWWYWLTHRAINGPNLETKGFGFNGKPTLAQVSRRSPARSAPRSMFGASILVRT